MAYYEGEINPLNNFGGYGNGGWGGNDAWWIIILLIFGWGNNFGGNGFGGRGAGSELVGYELGKVATANDVASGFNNSAVLSSLNDLKLGQSSMQNFINQGFSGVNTQLMSGFHGVDNAICTLGYQNQQGFNSLAHQISDCCCGLGRQIDGINYNMAKNTCDIVQAINLGNQKVIDYMQSEKIDTLNRKLAVAEGQISQYAQTNAIISALQPKCPVPAYQVPNPNCCYNGCGGSTI